MASAIAVDDTEAQAGSAGQDQPQVAFSGAPAAPPAAPPWIGVSGQEAPSTSGARSACPQRPTRSTVVQNQGWRGLTRRYQQAVIDHAAQLDYAAFGQPGVRSGYRATAELLRGHVVPAQEEALNLQETGRVLFQLCGPLSQMMHRALLDCPEVGRPRRDQPQLHEQWSNAVQALLRLPEMQEWGGVFTALQEPDLFELEEAVDAALDFLASWQCALPLFHDAVRMTLSTEEAQMARQQIVVHTSDPTVSGVEEARPLDVETPSE